MPKYWKYIIFTDSELQFDGYKIDKYSYDCKSMYQNLLKHNVTIPEQYVLYWEKKHYMSV